MLRGYLLDTNHVSAYFDRNEHFIARLKTTPPDQLFFISAVTVGEIEASYRITNRDPDVVSMFKKFVRETFLSGPTGFIKCFAIDEQLREHYAEIIANIWKTKPLPTPKQKTEAHLVVDFGVDINDVWIAATALQTGLTLLTSDRMKQICSSVPDLKVDNWLVSASASAL